MKSIQFVLVLNYLQLFIFLYAFAPGPNESPTDEELMEIMEPELYIISPNDRASFVELCITKRDECTEEQFSGKRAIFSWQPGLRQEKKIRFWQTYRCIFRRELDECPVDGGWSKWSSWSRCKADCDIRSTQMRTRACDNPRPAFGGDNCDGLRTDNRTCVGACTNVADGVAEARSFVRKMHDIFPGLAEMCMLKHCAYKQVEAVIKDAYKVSRYWSSIHCIKYDGACPVNGGWSEWGSWSECSVECGYGENFRKRLCDDPTPKNGGIFCQGAWYENKNCLAKKCDDTDVFTDWSNFSPCSESCGKFGVKTSVRTCLNLELCQKAGYKGTDEVITMPCYGGACPVAGGWSSWGFWTACSASCGTGRRTRMRKCDEPYPYNGEDCLGPSISESSCSGELCGKPVKEIEDEEEVPEEEEDEDDDDEDDDDEDAVTSGEGGDDELVESVDLDENAADSSLEGLVRKKRSPRQSRRRYLLEKIRESNARKFQTHAKRESSRKITFRKVQVESKKVTFSKVKTFEKFFRHHNKRNSSSRPQKLPHLKEGGSQSHDEVKFLSKSGKRVTRSLRSDGLWLVSHPKESNPASKHSFSQILPPRSMHTPSRAGPHRLNKRSSKVPMKKSDTFPKRITISSPTLNLLRKTRRPLRRSRRSNQWNELKSRLRVQAAFITKPVRKPDEISKDDPYDVPLNADLEYLYTPWTEWTLCTKTCGGGIRSRSRKCNNENIVCRGEISPIQFCNMDPCPVPGGWSTWEAWNPCSVTCSQGVSERYRACDRPLPKYGGSCPGPRNESRPCSAPTSCAENAYTWMEWTAWTTCSRTCGGGQRTRTRSRYLVTVITREETSVCNQQPCPVDGLWAAWEGWADCSKACGLGRAFRDRTCTDPSPVFGGDPCKGQGSESMICYSGPCQDSDDTGLYFDGEAYLVYPRRKHPTSFVMIFMRIKPVLLKGTIFHYYHLCKDDLHDCHISIMGFLKDRKVRLKAKVQKNGEMVTFSHPKLLNKRKWQDVFVLVTEEWAELRVNDDERHEVRFSENPTEGLNTSLNLVGELSVGANRQMEDGYQGKLAALRRNFKILKLFQDRNRTVRGQPIASHKVKKLSLAPEARHPDFENRYYSHLQFRESKYLYVSASFEITDSTGLLFFNGGKNGTSYISAQLMKGTIRLCLNCGQKPICHDGFTISSGNWYLLSVSAQGSEGEIRLNEGDAIQVNCPPDQNYMPRPSLYIGGGGPKDWRVVKRLVEGVVFYSGMIDTLSVNGWPVTYKMATLVGSDGEINTLGYSFSDMVTELRIPSNTMAKLKCGAPQKSRRSHIVRIVWFFNMRRLLPTPGTDIEDTESAYQTVSQVNLHPGTHSDGVYACVLSEDGVLSVRHVFVLLRYTRITPREKESRDEWIGFIFLLILIVLVIIGLCCYICQDQPYWKRVREKGYSQMENIGRRSMVFIKPPPKDSKRVSKETQTDDETEVTSVSSAELIKPAAPGKKDGQEETTEQSDTTTAAEETESVVSDVSTSSSKQPKKKGKKKPVKRKSKEKEKAPKESKEPKEKKRKAKPKGKGKRKAKPMPKGEDAPETEPESQSETSEPEAEKKPEKPPKKAKRKPDKKPEPKDEEKVPEKEKKDEEPKPKRPPRPAKRPPKKREIIDEEPAPPKPLKAPPKEPRRQPPKEPRRQPPKEPRRQPPDSKEPPPAATGRGDEEDQEYPTGCRYPKTFAELTSLRMPPLRNVPREKLPNTTNIPPPCVEPQPPCGMVDGFIQPVDILCNPYYVQGSAWQHSCQPCPGEGGDDEYLRKRQCLQMCGNNYVLAMNFPNNHSHPSNPNNFTSNNSNDVSKNDAKNLPFKKASNNFQEGTSKYLSWGSQRDAFFNDNWNFSAELPRNTFKDKQITTDMSSSYEENNVQREEFSGNPVSRRGASNTKLKNASSAPVRQLEQMNIFGVSSSSHELKSDVDNAKIPFADESEGSDAGASSIDMEWEQFTLLRQKCNNIENKEDHHADIS